MTPIDKALDHSPLTKESPLTLYRLTSQKYATSLSGLGAAMYPGRWNLPGEEAIYTSTEIGVCVLERLVHTPKNRMPADLALMTIKLAGDWSRRGEGLALDQKTGSMWTIYTTLVQGQQEWPVVHGVDEELAAAHVALAIPSVIVPAWNVVLYPRASGFWDHVSLGSVEPFDYDPRLFPDQTPVQP